ncbi:hypothetical protein HNQ59_003395 [Chitinivorax tropicus]|uniref:DUF2782 domain-containing protein n=1 Tax=Chitinivorax tropicus TaxID=714531 RepID=A0A840MTH2_9PROT|nr:DUF2782 domain-containing protein [Chitinivorax tropicus]MBB5020082.1 hypothetical protein [Chitinivorax tropicus]
MKRLTLVLMLAGAATALAAPPKDTSVPPPPPMPEKTKEDRAQAEPQVTVIEKADETIAEYRMNGKLYMIKVTPRNGLPYYLIDESGAGQMVRREGEPALKPPMWVLFTF